MKTIVKYSLIWAFLLISYAIMAKSTTGSEAGSPTIHGRIVDSSTGSAMEYVSVAAYNSADSSLVTGTITSIDGLFKIEKMSLGNYFLKISFVGFESLQTQTITLTNKSKHFNVGDITLSPTSTQLEGVVVNAEKSRIEYKIDKRVINVDKDLSTKGGTAANVLENTPSVQVDPQGNVTLRGSSDFMVLVNEKPSVIKGSDLLKQIPANTIKQIEVITNPSMRYEADGKAGIINVILKKDVLEGLNGTIDASVGNLGKSNGNVNLNYRMGKLNIFGGASYNINPNNTFLTIDNKSVINNTEQFTHEKATQFNDSRNISFRGGFDYDFNEKNTLSVSASMGKQSYDNGSHAQFHYFNRDYSFNSYGKSSSHFDVDGIPPAFSIDYTHTFAENHTLSVSSNVSGWNGTVTDPESNFITDYLYNAIDTSSMFVFSKNEYNYQYRANLDYKRPLAGGSLETGLQYRYEYRQEDIKFNSLNVSQNTWTLNDTFSYLQHYYNPIYSGYLTYSNKLMNWNYMLGLRSEIFHRDIQIPDRNQEYIYDKLIFYPSLHISREFTGNQQLQLSYSRRINRPVPWILNTIPSYIDPKNVFVGSPYLKPEFTNAYEINYRKTISIVTVSTQTYFRQTTNSFSTLRLMDSTGIMRHTLTNSNSQNAAGVELGVDINVFKWWQISTGTNMYHYTLETTVGKETQQREVDTWDSRFVSNFTLPWKTRIQTVFYYRAPTVDAMGKSSGFYTTNLAINQPLLKGKLNMSFSVQNIFNSIQFDYKVKGSNFDNTYNIHPEGPVCFLNLSYNFNNFNNKKRGRADDINFKGGGSF